MTISPTSAKTLDWKRTATLGKQHVVGLQPQFTGLAKLAYVAGVSCWAAAMLFFWSWWLDPGHIIGVPSYVMLTVILLWITVLPGYFIYMFFGAREMAAGDNLRVSGRVAMVVTKAPSEPFSVVRTTLRAMLDQEGYDFDVWLADEDPSEETRIWCEEHGVLISTRHGVKDYHRDTWPRRTRCKEGNLAYFYDRYGYQRYDFVAQFDADHVPEPTYLREILKPFSDPRVGYVSAPSICDSNAAQSWAARGRLQAEASLHGCLQVGYNNGWAPLCIGSHYAVRTAALRKIGGLGPELAEDHSTTLMMNAGGWKGVHAVAAIAHGEGPRTFADLAIQEFQWSRSLVTILLRYSPRYVPKLSARLRFQFVFSQLWYPLFSTFMAVMFLLPVVALARGRNLVNVTYPDFLAHILPLSLALVVLAFYWRSTGKFRPYDAKILGWESIVFLLARWPWSLAGTLAAIRDQLTGSFVDFRITPKGAKVKSFPPARVLVPYLALVLVSGGAALLVRDGGSARGFYLFTIINALVYSIVLAVIVVNHARENGLGLLRVSVGGWVAKVALVSSFVITFTALHTRGLEGLQAIEHGQDIVKFTETQFGVAGAGLGGPRVTKVRLNIRWNGFSCVLGGVSSCNAI